LVTLREAGIEIFKAAVQAGDVRLLLERFLHREGPFLSAGPATFDLSKINRLLVVGAGKASGAMAAALEDLVGDRISDGLVVVKEGHRAHPKRIREVEAGHPIPDERGLAAARDLLDLVRSAGRDDLVIFLVSGGGSALLPAPVPPITLAEKQTLTRLLLEAGATINELNAVRKHCSGVKGGRLAQAAAPASVLSLILSDVIGDPLDVIASGPTAPDPTTYADALAILTRFGLRDRAPRTVVTHLERGARGEIPETPKADDPLFRGVTNLVIGNNRLVVEGAIEKATALGFHPFLLTQSLQGEAREVAREFVAQVAPIRSAGQPVPPPACVIAGGETTVTVKGKGTGGRCQEFCLAAALAIKGMRDVVVLAAGSDGSDGPTDAAGATADGWSVGRGREKGVEARALLDSNGSYRFFSTLGDLITTGPTRTNLLDLYLLLVGPLPDTHPAAARLSETL
jgi:hydroxypyruvate reductase